MIKDLFHKEFLNDRPAVVLTVIGVLIAIVNLVSIVLTVRASDFDVPVRFTQYGTSPLVLGEWYMLYELALFTLVAPAVNTVVSLRLHRVRRSLSLALLLVNLVILAFLFMVTRALLGLYPG